MPVSKVYFSVPPVNDLSISENAGAISGGFSNAKGNGNIRFQISAQDRLLDTSDMYLTGRIIHVKSDGTPLVVPVGTTKANYNAQNGVNLQKVANQNISNWGGVSNMIKRVVVQSKKTSVNVSENRNYPMYVNARTAWTHSKDDFLVSPLLRTAASGTYANDLNRKASTMAAANAMANVGPTLTALHYGKPFSFKLETALLDNVKEVHLGNDFMGGLVINLELSQEDGFYYNRFEDTGTNQATAPVDGSYYIVKDLKLTGRLSIPTPQDLANYNSQMLLGSRFNLINDVTSSTNSNKYTPNVSSVRSIVNIYLDQNQENNRNKNENNMRVPLGLREYTQQKQNTRTPQDYVIEVEPNLLKRSDEAGNVINPSQAGKKASYQGDAEVRNLFQRAVLNGEVAGKTACSLELQNDVIDEQYNATRGATSQDNGVGLNTKANAMGIGIDYTFHMGETSDFRQRDYDNLIKSGVASGNANLPASRASLNETVQSYIKNVSAFDSKTLMMSQ